LVGHFTSSVSAFSCVPLNVPRAVTSIASSKFGRARPGVGDRHPVAFVVHQHEVERFAAAPDRLLVQLAHHLHRARRAAGLVEGDVGGQVGDERPGAERQRGHDHDDADPHTVFIARRSFPCSSIRRSSARTRRSTPHRNAHTPIQITDGTRIIAVVGLIK
jgi:hypothetical protein